MITFNTRLYVRVGILFTRGKLLHDCIISLREEVWTHKTILTPPLLLKCLYQLRKGSSHVSIMPLSLQFSIRFWNCSNSVVFLFCFSFDHYNDLLFQYYGTMHVKLSLALTLIVLFSFLDFGESWLFHNKRTTYKRVVTIYRCKCKVICKRRSVCKFNCARACGGKKRELEEVILILSFWKIVNY